MNRITDILKDEESLRQLSELAEMLRSGDFSGAESETAAPPEADGMFNMEMMMKLTGLAGAMNTEDQNTELLLALRPHLSEPSRQRLDRAVKLMKLIAVYEAAKESGLLNNFF